MSFRFIEDHRDVYPVRLMCAVLEVANGGPALPSYKDVAASVDRKSAR